MSCFFCPYRVRVWHKFTDFHRFLSCKITVTVSACCFVKGNIYNYAPKIANRFVPCLNAKQCKRRFEKKKRSYFDLLRVLVLFLSHLCRVLICKTGDLPFLAEAVAEQITDRGLFGLPCTAEDDTRCKRPPHS